MDGVGRKVRRVECAEGRVDRFSSGIGGTARLCVTGFAVSGPGEVGASFHKRAIGRARRIDAREVAATENVIKTAPITEAQAFIIRIAAPDSARCLSEVWLTLSAQV